MKKVLVLISLFISCSKEVTRVEEPIKPKIQATSTQVKVNYSQLSDNELVELIKSEFKKFEKQPRYNCFSNASGVCYDQRLLSVMYLNKVVAAEEELKKRMSSELQELSEVFLVARQNQKEIQDHIDKVIVERRNNLELDGSFLSETLAELNLCSLEKLTCGREDFNLLKNAKEVGVLSAFFNKLKDRLLERGTSAYINLGKTKLSQKKFFTLEKNFRNYIDSYKSKEYSSIKDSLNEYVFKGNKEYFYTDVDFSRPFFDPVFGKYFFNAFFRDLLIYANQNEKLISAISEARYSDSAKMGVIVYYKIEDFDSPVDVEVKELTKQVVQIKVTSRRE